MHSDSNQPPPEDATVLDLVLSQWATQVQVGDLQHDVDTIKWAVASIQIKLDSLLDRAA